MAAPLEVHFRGIKEPPKMRAWIEERARKLKRYAEFIHSMRVVVEARHQHQNKGFLYHVRLEIGVPRVELVIDRDPKDHQSHQDLHTALRDAFEAAAHRLSHFKDRLKDHHHPEGIAPV